METVECATYTARQRDQLADGDQDPWGVRQFGLLWRDTTGHVLAREGDELVAHAGWVEADLCSDSHVVPVVGLGAVLVHPRARGRGLGKAIVRAAMTSMQRIGRPIGLLFCLGSLVPFYEKLGWVQTTDPVEVDQPSGKVNMPVRSCWIPLRDDATLPTGRLSLDGLPF